MRVNCCNKVVSRQRENKNYVWFICWTCGFLQRIRFRLVPGLEGINEELGGKS